MQRSILLFENSIKSNATQKTYLYHLTKFMKFFQIPDYDKLASITTEKMQIMVEDYVMDLKTKLSPNSLNLPISALKAFLDCNDIELRYSSKMKSTSLLKWIKKNNFPHTFQILCHNCNFAKGHSKDNKCPHERK